MKVCLLIVDIKTGIYQQGMLDEPVKEGFEIQNALKHFGASYGEINWIFSQNSPFQVKYGEITGTSKVVYIMTI